MYIYTHGYCIGVITKILIAFYNTYEHRDTLEEFGFTSRVALPSILVYWYLIYVKLIGNYYKLYELLVCDQLTL